MGKGFLYGSSGGKAKKTPVLSTSYPANATVEINNSVTCEVRIATAGYPEAYSYQWYKNGVAVSGATGDSYTFTPTAVGSTTVYCKVTNAAGTVTSRTATITANPVYLYNAGDTCDDLTGGWTSIALPMASVEEGNNKEPTITYGTDSITFKIELSTYKTGLAYINNKIDLTPYSKIRIKGSTAAAGVGTDQYLCAQSAIGTYYNQNLAASVSVANANSQTFDTYLDVSALSGEYYIGLFLRGVQYGNPNLTVTYLAIEG